MRHGEASELGGVRRGLEEQPELLRHGPGAVLHAIVDRVVDDYGPALAGLGEDIDEVEDEVFSHERTNAAERIYKLKREVLQFEHAVGPLVDPVDRLARGEYSVIHPEVRDLLPRRQRPPAARPRPARGLSATCSPASWRRTWPR